MSRSRPDGIFSVAYRRLTIGLLSLVAFEALAVEAALPVRDGHRR